MDSFSDKNSEVEIPDWIPPLQLTNEERAAILAPRVSAGEGEIGGESRNIFEEAEDTKYDNMCGAMSLTLRRRYDILASFRVMGVKTQNFQRALTEVKGEAAFLPLVSQENRLSAVFVIELSLASALFEVACGGYTRAGNVPKLDLTHWNAQLLQRLLQPLSSIWSDDVMIESVDADPEFSQSLAPNMSINRVEFSAKFDGVMGQCLLLV